MKKKCDVCKKKLQGTTVSLGKQPLCDDLRKSLSTKILTFRIDLKLCGNCLTVNQLHSVNQKKLFPADYKYRSGLTEDVKIGLKDLALTADKMILSKKKKILDVGCNDGTLLNFFKNIGYNTIGIEPTNAFKDANKKHFIYNEYLNEVLAKKIKNKYKKIDIITFTNVFAHIPNFQELIKSVKILMSITECLVIENHYLGSILNKNQFDTFYQEHPRTYSLSSFIAIASLLKLKINKVDFPRRYGGNIRVFMSKKKTSIYKQLLYLSKNEKNNFHKKFHNLKNIIKIWTKNKKNILKKYKLQNYKIYGKAFPGRASILINLLKLNKNYIECIFEKDNSKKNYHYAPGTNIPILPDKTIAQKINKNKKYIIINFAWHIKKEIKNYLSRYNLKNIIHIVQKSDFQKNN
jgi:SAM-dependent methyltransferase